MGLFCIFLCIVLLAILCMLGVHVILSSVISAVILCILLGLPIYDSIMGPMMTGFGSFISTYFVLILLGGFLSSILAQSGSTESIARALSRAFGTKYTMVAIVCIGVVLGLGGVNMYVAYFAVMPIAFSMLRRADLPRRLWIGAWVAGTSTFAMTGPFVPTMQNAVGIKYLGTTAAAGWQVGLIGWIPFGLLVVYHEYRSGVRAKKRGEHFIARPDDKFYDAASDDNLPHWLLPVIPIALLILLMNILAWQIEICLLLSAFSAAVMLWKYLPRGRGEITKLVKDTLGNVSIAVLTPAATVGFASLVTSTDAFAGLSATAAEMNWDPFVTSAAVAGLGACFSGSCVAGLSISFPTCLQMFGNSGINLETLHRVATIGAGTIDSLPYSGALNMYAQVAGEKMKDVYWDIFFVSVLCPIGATTLSILSAYLLGFAYT